MSNPNASSASPQMTATLMRRWPWRRGNRTGGANYQPLGRIVRCSPLDLRWYGLTLRALEPADVPAMFAYLQRPAVYEATSSSGWTEASVAEFVRTNREGMADGRWCRYAIVPDGAETIAGDIGDGVIEHAHRRAEVGYHLSPDCWGHGLMTRAVRALNAWAFESGLHRIEATVMEGNVRSNASCSGRLHARSHPSRLQTGPRHVPRLLALGADSLTA